uniref:Myozenin 1b n=1 Tax=Cyclopterus lumpus TaxID=8103 RepID=A0A8C3AJM8_CYCLU
RPVHFTTFPFILSSSFSVSDDTSDPEASELDLGTKIKTPKDTMLEELSLNTNKGSKMFKMRQQRVEKFIVTAQNKVRVSVRLCKACVYMGGATDDTMAENEKRRKEYAPTYISPWERAMKGNEELTATMKATMPGPIQMHSELPLYKSFNRTALPFGGYDKVPKKLTFEFQELNGDSEEPESMPSMQANIGSRPSFNRTPIGWVCSEDNPNIHMDLDSIPFDGETDDL